MNELDQLLEAHGIQPPSLVTIREIATMLGVKYWKAYSLVGSGIFGPPARVIGTSHLYSRSVVLDVCRRAAELAAAAASPNAEPSTGSNPITS